MMTALEKLITAIGFEDSDKNEILAFASDTKNAEAMAYINGCLDRKEWGILREKTDDPLYAMAALTVILKLAVSVREEYERCGISEEIYLDTMSDIRVWAYNHKRASGHLGLSELEWVIGFATFGRFKLGRLQYNFTAYNKEDERDASMPLSTGDCMLDVHIQQDGAFTDELCGESLAMAAEFFRIQFPERDIKGFMCHSWLLSPGLAQVLPETSNIIKFGKRFTIIDNQTENDGQAIERIFDTKFKERGGKPTSLQIKAKALLDGGGHLGNALGVILL